MGLLGTYRRTLLSFGLGLLAILALSACVGSPSAPQNPLLGPPPSSRPAPPRDFKITVYQGQAVLGGEAVQFSQLLNRGTPIVLNFWAGACAPCRAELPDFEQVHQMYKERVLLFGLDVGPFVGLGSRADGQDLLRELGVTYPAGTTFDQGVMSSYQVLGMPTTLFLKPDGTIFKKRLGLLTKEEMETLFRDLLIASRPS